MNVPKNVGRRGAPFIAPGGSQVGNYMVHVYTSNGTFVPESEGVIDMLLVAGGGGAGGAGGGAGGFRELTNITLTAQSYSVQVGAGGAGINSQSGTAFDGGDSWLANQSGTKLYEASGGGRNGFPGAGNHEGAPGGSGGGGDTDGEGGAGNIGGYSPVEGYGGGGSPLINERACGGGGGGASEVGEFAPGDGGDGGNGRSNTYRGQGSQFYAGGGGGGAYGHPQAGNGAGGQGGQGGGGSGGGNHQGVWGGPGTPGTANTGGGGGAGQTGGAQVNTSRGGSGIVIIRYAIDQ